MTDFTHKLLDGRQIAAAMHETIHEDAAALKESGWPVRLVSIAVGDSKPAELYIRNQARIAEKVGIAFEDRFYPDTTGADELLGIIHGLNVDPRVSGVIIQRPLPKHIPVRAVQRAVHPFKDVEGLHPASIGDIVYNDLVMGPCTAVAAVEILKTTPLKLEGLEVVVIGHSEIVGKPIAFLLMGAGATVTVCHAMTRNLAIHSRQADAVFVAVGKPGLVTAEMLKPGAALIDIGINQVSLPDGSAKVVGDADFDSCVAVAGWITPVPGGVGPVTVATLMRNAVRAASLQRAAYEKSFATTEAVYLN
ncbi:bifunctional 5,10-methylenetetrahydrofolate dehydrogenase/5,10-methenyltetrahydrofolate cyclohydrolase [Rhodoligotrophos ferricapiens]|uniref:bifunctional 5,10-methylenetetrahydrofolate dehydrogenase/5,10-methenyltetrahydrofolate cyclohydrolase n=1 Tax=Rhodoligotrophos ferricapiens TaxID=3069264 RepID=UPI00315D9C89